MPAILAIRNLCPHPGAVAFAARYVAAGERSVEVTRDGSKLSAWVLPAVQRARPLAWQRPDEIDTRSPSVPVNGFLPSYS